MFLGLGHCFCCLLVLFPRRVSNNSCETFESCYMTFSIQTASVGNISHILLASDMKNSLMMWAVMLFRWWYIVRTLVWITSHKPDHKWPPILVAWKRNHRFGASFSEVHCSQVLAFSTWSTARGRRVLETSLCWLLELFLNLFLLKWNLNRKRVEVGNDRHHLQPIIFYLNVRAWNKQSLSLISNTRSFDTNIWQRFFLTSEMHLCCSRFCL